MLLSTVFVLRPLAEVMLPMTLGNAFYTALLQLVAHHDQNLAARLHDTNGPKPFTTSPLQGPVTVRGRQLLVQRDCDYWLRVTSVEERLSHILLAMEEHPPQTLPLHGGQFAVVQMSSQAHAHPWAARMPYDALYETAVPREMRSRSQVTLVFESPTAFRSQGQTLLFPLPRLVFGSLIAR
jgi:hypothetical protein